MHNTLFLANSGMFGALVIMSIWLFWWMLTMKKVNRPRYYHRKKRQNGRMKIRRWR